MTRRSLALCAALGLLPGLAWAHSPIKGLDNFYAGLLHPVFVPAHLLSILVLGVLLGQQGAQRVQVAIVACLVALLVGLAASVPAAAISVEVPLLAFAAVSGALVALARPLPVPAIAALGGVVTLLVGVDSAQEGLSGRGWLAAMLGSAIAAYLLLLYAMVFAEWFGRREWQRIGLRILGSWAAASALLVLSLALRG